MERRRRVETSSSRSNFKVGFRKANQLQAEPDLAFGDENLDRLLGGLRLGHVAFLYGSSQCLETSEFLCVRVQLDSHSGGFDSDVIFLDGGNTFDPYLITQYAEQLSLDRDRTLDRILVSRAFTYHQLTSLITQTLPDAVQERRAKLVIISDIIEPYCDDVLSVLSLDLFKTALNSLITTARSEKAIVLATSLDEKKSKSDRFLRAIRQRVNVVLKFEEQHNSTTMILEKHPTRSGKRLIIKRPTPRVLEKFLEADADG